MYSQNEIRTNLYLENEAPFFLDVQSSLSKNKTIGHQFFRNNDLNSINLFRIFFNYITTNIKFPSSKFDVGTSTVKSIMETRKEDISEKILEMDSLDDVITPISSYWVKLKIKEVKEAISIFKE